MAASAASRISDEVGSPSGRARIRFAVLAACLILSSARQLRADEYSEISRYSARLFSYGTLAVDARVGDVKIEGWDEPRVEIEAEKVVRAGSEAKAKRLYEQVKIELAGGDKEVRLRTIFPPRRPWRLFRGATQLAVNFKIRMPYDANAVLRCANGDVHVRGVTGNQQIRVGYGDVEVNVPSARRLRSLDARAWLGYAWSDLHGEEGAGFTRKISFWNPAGRQDIRVRVRFGGVYVYAAGR